MACAAGQYTPGPGYDACLSCPAGSYCLTPFEDPVQCPPGHYSLGGQTNCTLCAAGEECPDQSQGPALCLEGEYSFSGNYTCTLCPAGYRCPSTSQAPLPCAAGQYSSAGATNCSVCQPGQRLHTGNSISRALTVHVRLSLPVNCGFPCALYTGKLQQHSRGCRLHTVPPRIRMPRHDICLCVGLSAWHVLYWRTEPVHWLPGGSRVSAH